MFIIALLLLVSVGATSDSIDASRARGCRSCSKYAPKTPSLDRPAQEGHFQRLAQRDVVLTEGFDVAPPPTWTVIARSDPPVLQLVTRFLCVITSLQGIDTVSQGLPDVFPAQSGPPDSFAAMTFNNVGAGEPGIIR
jgi:hypothetical protein